MVNGCRIFGNGNGRLNAVILKWIRYSDRFGVVLGTRIFLTLHLLGRFKKMGELIAVPMGNKTSIILRSHTTDEAIFWQIFVLADIPIPDVSNQKVILDCGAHIGCTAILFAQRYQDAKIIAVEASFVNYEILVKNTLCFPNITCVHGAIWGEKSRVWISGVGDGEWSFRVDSQGAGESMPAFSIDDVLSDQHLDHIDILKMDIEGSELNVFQSQNLKWLDKTHVIIIELHDAIMPGCTEQFLKTIGPGWKETARTGSNVMMEREGKAVAV